MSRRLALLLAFLVVACTFDPAGIGPSVLLDGSADAVASLDRSLDGPRPADQGPDATALDILGPVDGPDLGPTTPWWDTAWKRRRKLTFLNKSGQQDLNGFPVLVVLDSQRVDYGAMDKDGKDIRFVDADQSTVLPHEIERWQAGSASHVWVRVPQIDKLSDVDHIWLYHGNPAAADGQQAAQVWGTDSTGVWHLDGDYKDSSTLTNHATNHGAGNTPGLVAGAQELKGSQYIELPNVASLDLDELSVSLWVKSSQVWDGADWPGNATLVTRATAGWCSHDWTIFAGRDATDSGNAGRVIVANGACTGSGWEPRFSSGTGLNDGAFRHLAYTRSKAGDNRLYVDGKQVATMQDDGSSVAADRPIQVGGEQYHSGGSYLVGVIDELRMAKVVRPAAWIEAEHRAGKDLLVSYGAEEIAP